MTSKTGGNNPAARCYCPEDLYPMTKARLLELQSPSTQQAVPGTRLITGCSQRAVLYIGQHRTAALTGDCYRAGIKEMGGASTGYSHV